MKTSTTTLRFTRLAMAAAAAAAVAIGMSACSAAASGTHGKTHSGAAARPNAGGASTQVSPAERARALAALRSANPADGNVSLSRVLSALPAAELPEVSGNWSGYEVLSARTGQPARSASGTWVVPAVTSPGAGKPGFSSIWVGVGGNCLDAACHTPDPSLIQLGTSQDASASGQTSYSAWYETLPQSETPLPQLSVAPGDTVSAGLSVRGAATASGQTWLLWMTVRSPSGHAQNWSKVISYDSSLSSAEWIVEGPSAVCGGHIGELPLADYHTVAFSHLLENGAVPSLGLPDMVVGYDPYGQLSIPAPASLLHGRTATYFLPFLPKGAAQTQGRAACQSTLTAGTH
jgi:peptidase A4-like protein